MVLLIIGASLTAWHLYRVFFHPDLFRSSWSLAVNLLLVPATVAWACYSVACPRCHLRLLPFAARTYNVSEFAHRIAYLNSCPRCDYRP